MQTPFLSLAGSTVRMGCTSGRGRRVGIPSGARESHPLSSNRPGNDNDLLSSRIFDYENIEVIRYLLCVFSSSPSRGFQALTSSFLRLPYRSNLHFCVDRLGFDGFRFDSVSSMLFDHHAIDTSFTGDYGEYLSSETDHAGVEYLMLVRWLLIPFHA